MKILGYKYFNELDALDISESLNIYYGIPTSENAETTSVVLVNYGIDDTNTEVWYIIYHPMCEALLGSPQEFIIIEQLDRNIQN